MFADFISFEITKNGVESTGRGEIAEKFGRIMKIKAPYFRRLTSHGIESIEAKEALYTQNRSIYFSKDVKLMREDGWYVETDRLYFDLKKKIYTTQGRPFTAYYGKSVIVGRSMVYYQKSGKIRADSIKAKIATEDI